MSRKPQLPLFLQQSTYRQRRLRDAIKLLPLLALVLWSIPLAWPQGAIPGQIRSQGVIYIFGVWIVIVLLGAFLTWRMRDSEAADGSADKDL